MLLSLAYCPIICLAGLARRADAFAAVRRPSIAVATVTSPPNVIALADLRYAEWIAEAPGDDRNGSGTSVGDEPKLTSLGAFRMATAEIQSERAAEGAVAFLARLKDEGDKGGDRAGTVVGAAELSPIEFNGALRRVAEEGGRLAAVVRELGASTSMLYVTDVVTSKMHRRMGVGEALMGAVETKALSLGASHLFLHVEKENSAALKFYRSHRLGYCIPPADVLRGIDVERLAQNAGTTGQLLLSKELSMLKRNKMGAAGGFGSAARKRSTKKKKKSR